MNKRRLLDNSGVTYVTKEYKDEVYSYFYDGVDTNLNFYASGIKIRKKTIERKDLVELVKGAVINEVIYSEDEIEGDDLPSSVISYSVYTFKDLEELTNKTGYINFLRLIKFEYDSEDYKKYNDLIFYLDIPEKEDENSELKRYEYVLTEIDYPGNNLPNSVKHFIDDTNSLYYKAGKNSIWFLQKKESYFSGDNDILNDEGLPTIIVSGKED